jgi:cytoskeletal protein CcmA (bactofilin family)
MSLKDNFNQAIKEILRRDGAVAPLSPAELEKLANEGKAPAVSAPNANAMADSDDGAGVFEDMNLAPSGNPRVSDADALLRSVKGADSDVSGVSRSESVSYPKGSAVEALLGGADRAPDYSAAGRAPGEPRRTDNQTGYSGQGYPGQGYAPQGGYASQNYAPQGYSQGGYSSQGSAPSGGYNAYAAAGVGPVSSERFEAEETTIISRNTVIDGNIRAFANVSIEGSVKGDVKITKDITMSGRVVGNIECNNTSLTGASMQGSVVSKGQVQLDRDSLLLGDISAQYVNINGKIRGNIEIGGKAEFKSEAYVLGNISAATITVIDGANIQGYVNTTAFREVAGSVFPESISVEGE